MLMTQPHDGMRCGSKGVERERFMHFTNQCEIDVHRICVLSTCILARQGSSESDVGISTRYVLFMFDEHVDDKAPRWTQVCPKSFHDGPKIAPT